MLGLTSAGTYQELRRRAVSVTALLLVSTFLVVAPASAAVSVSRAEVVGTNLRIEGTAAASRDITVDGLVMGRSDTGGRFRIDRTSYTSPADCTVDVNDGSAAPRVATLSGCTVRTPPPPTGPGAPSPLTPAEGAGVTTPLTLSWSAVIDPASINGGYNWEMSSSATFAQLVTRDSTLPSLTQEKVGGLGLGTYFWRVQAVDGALVQSAWSSTRSFTVTGAGTGALSAPVLAPLPFGTQYHPMEHFTFSWNAVAGATSYVVEASADPTFPAPVDVRFTNVPDTTYGLTFNRTLIGSWNLRVYGVGADGVAGAPSNVRTFTISYAAPIGPAPTLVSPVDGANLELPITLDWNDVENPQSSGYEAQVATDPAFSNVEVQTTGLTNSQYSLLGLTSGTKYWRVRHAEGDASPTTAAVTAWSQVRSFTVTTAPARIASVSLLGATSAFSGTEQVGELQLTGPAPAGGAVVQLTSTQPGATPVPATVLIGAGTAFAQFRFVYGQVTAPTAATITATYVGSTSSVPITVNPPSLKEVGPSANRITGGAVASAFVGLNGAAPAGGAVVSLTSSSPLAVPPTTVTVPPGGFFQDFTIATSAVAVATTVTITASWKGLQVTHQLTLDPGVPPAEWTVDPVTTIGSQGSSARVAIAAIQTTDVTFTLTSSDPNIAWMAPTVTIPAGSPHAGVLVLTTNPAATTIVTLSVSGAGVSKTATLTVNPIPLGPLPAPTLLSPASGARFAPGQSVPFDWADVPNAASYTLQVSSASTFTSILLERSSTLSQVTASFAATGDRFWRVRANRPDGSAGGWSAVRSFRVN